MKRTYFIVIPGVPRTKKNGQTFSYRYRDKAGRLHYRDKPLVFLKKAYKEWVKTAVSRLVTFKSRYPEGTFPLRYKVNLKIISYIPSKIGRIDLSALYEGIQDVLCGNAHVSKKIKKEYYQILVDDSYKWVGGHDGSRIYIDSENPRMEIFIEPFEDD